MFGKPILEYRALAPCTPATPELDRAEKEAHLSIPSIHLSIPSIHLSIQPSNQNFWLLTRSYRSWRYLEAEPAPFSWSLVLILGCGSTHWSLFLIILFFEHPWLVLEEVLPATFNTIQFPLSNPPCLTLKYRAAGWDCLLIADNIWYRLLLPSLPACLPACCLLLLRWKQATATSLQGAPACTLHPPAYNHKRLKMQRNAISNIKNPCTSIQTILHWWNDESPIKKNIWSKFYN